MQSSQRGQIKGARKRNPPTRKMTWERRGASASSETEEKPPVSQRSQQCFARQVADERGQELEAYLKNTRDVSRREIGGPMEGVLSEKARQIDARGCFALVFSIAPHMC